MAIRTVRYLACDWCGGRFALPHLTGAHASAYQRAEAKRIGWVRGRKGQDYCAECHRRGCPADRRQAVVNP
jgi:hypothetical protein